MCDHVTDVTVRFLTSEVSFNETERRGEVFVRRIGGISTLLRLGIDNPSKCSSCNNVTWLSHENVRTIFFVWASNGNEHEIGYFRDIIIIFVGLKSLTVIVESGGLASLK